MKIVAGSRKVQGSGASRRLRNSAKVPGIVYGGTVTPSMIEIDHNPLYHALRVEAFHSSILDMELDGKVEKVLLRDVQWHPYRPLIQHIDFQRVAADRKITMRVPLHFLNQENSPAVKLSAAMVSHIVSEIVVSCLPGNLPEFVSVDLANLEVGKPLHIKDIALPEGVTAVATGNPVIVTASVKGGVEEEPTPTAAAPAAAAAAPAPAKKDDKK
jgi:large subunit ribosomal protein L25